MMKASKDTATPRNAHQNKMAISVLLNPLNSTAPASPKPSSYPFPAPTFLQDGQFIHHYFHQSDMSHIQRDTSTPNKIQSYIHPYNSQNVSQRIRVSSHNHIGPSYHVPCLHRSAQHVKNKRSPSNKSYSREEVDFIRYMKEDCRLSFEEVQRQFMAVFPGKSQLSTQCLSARLYRDNTIPRRDENNFLVRNEHGKVIWDEFKVRSRSTPDGKSLCIPYTLVDMYPWRAVRYRWVSERHKRLAQSILDGRDPSDPLGKKASWRRLIQECENIARRNKV